MERGKSGTITIFSEKLLFSFIFTQDGVRINSFIHAKKFYSWKIPNMFS